MADESQQEWHLDKRVPVALILTLIGQMTVAIWWAASINTRLANVETQMTAAAARSEEVDRIVAGQTTQIAVLVERIVAQSDRVAGLTQQVEATNTLLREYLRRNGGIE
jgi:hypothetical protein